MRSGLSRIGLPADQNGAFHLHPAARCDILRIEKGTTAHKVVDQLKNEHRNATSLLAKVSGVVFLCLISSVTNQINECQQ